MQGNINLTKISNLTNMLRIVTNIMLQCNIHGALITHNIVNADILITTTPQCRQKNSLFM